MATTTNYGWTTPDDTALVKDGAAAIRSLGTAIDTSMNTALGTKKAGLVLLNTTSFSAVASQSINNVFTSTYTNYRVIITFTTSVTASANLRLRASGSDDSAGDYSTNLSAQNADNLHSASATRTNYPFSYDVGDNLRFAIIDILQPQLATNTLFNSDSWTRNQQSIAAGGKLTTTQYDGFSIIASTGTITGDVWTYGYNK